MIGPDLAWLAGKRLVRTWPLVGVACTRLQLCFHDGTAVVMVSAGGRSWLEWLP